MNDKVEPNLSVGGSGEPWCMRLLAGELRWINHKDIAMERRILLEAKTMEDQYYAGRGLLEERKRSQEMEAVLESK